MKDPVVMLLGEWAGKTNISSALLRVFIAVVYASVMGLERASKRHSAGLRTFVLITITSAVSIVLDLMLENGNGVFIPVLSASAVIGAIAISLKSVVFSARNQIKGLTTAAGLLAGAFLGLCVGAGFYTVSFVLFIALLVILALFPRIEIYLKNRSNHFEIHLELKERGSLQNFVSTIRRLGLRIDDIEANSAYAGSGLSVFSITLTIISPELKKYKTHKEIIEALKSLDYIYHIEEMN